MCGGVCGGVCGGGGAAKPVAEGSITANTSVKRGVWRYRVRGCVDACASGGWRWLGAEGRDGVLPGTQRLCRTHCCGSRGFREDRRRASLSRQQSVTFARAEGSRAIPGTTGSCRLVLSVAGYTARGVDPHPEAGHLQLPGLASDDVDHVDPAGVVHAVLAVRPPGQHALIM